MKIPYIFAILCGSLVSAPAAASAPAPELASLALICNNLENVDPKIKMALLRDSDILASEPEELEVCFSPPVLYKQYEFTVIQLRSPLWCGARGDCTTLIFGHKGTQTYKRVSNYVTLPVELKLRVTQTGHGNRANLEIDVGLGSFSWHPAKNSFEYSANH